VASPRWQSLGEVTSLFLKLGATAFGGPAAHIGLMHDEIVKRRQWLTDQEFLDLIGATNLIPGPNSTEMAIHVGYRRAGWPGLILAGLCFIMPAVIIVGVLAWFYVQFGSTPQAQWLLYGIKPVVIAIIAQALWNLGKRATKGLTLVLIGLAVLGLYFAGINEIALLFAGGAVAMLITNRQRLLTTATRASFLPPSVGLGWLAPAALAPVAFTLPLLFLTFLKIGAVLYGSGYVLLAFLRADFVVRYAWLTDRQLLDAIAVGQVTPGPLFTSATFIGYILGGVPGAILATLGIFLPSFIFVALSGPFIPRIRNSPWLGAFLDGVNIAALALMAAVTWQLGKASLIDVPGVLIAAASLVLLIRLKVNSTWLILGGGLLGLLRGALG
jgi:chromate transporter